MRKPAARAPAPAARGVHAAGMGGGGGGEQRAAGGGGNAQQEMPNLAQAGLDLATAAMGVLDVAGAGSGASAPNPAPEASAPSAAGPPAAKLAWKAGEAVVRTLYYTNETGISRANWLSVLTVEEAEGEGGARVRVKFDSKVRQWDDVLEFHANSRTYPETALECNATLNECCEVVAIDGTEDLREAAIKKAIEAGMADSDDTRKLFPENAAANKVKETWFALTHLFSEPPVSSEPTQSRGIECLEVKVEKTVSTAEQVEAVRKGGLTVDDGSVDKLFPPIQYYITGVLEKDSGRPHQVTIVQIKDLEATMGSFAKYERDPVKRAEKNLMPRRGPCEVAFNHHDYHWSGLKSSEEYPETIDANGKSGCALLKFTGKPTKMYDLIDKHVRPLGINMMLAHNFGGLDDDGDGDGIDMSDMLFFNEEEIQGATFSEFFEMLGLDVNNF